VPEPVAPVVLIPESASPAARSLLTRLIDGAELPEVRDDSDAAPTGSPQTASTVDLSTAPPSARALLARLVPGAQAKAQAQAQAKVETTPANASAPSRERPTSKPAQTTVSKQARGVLDRLLPGDRP
jgi:hypothetical protein